MFVSIRFPERGPWNVYKASSYIKRNFKISTIAKKLDERYIGYIKMDCEVVLVVAKKK